jgi:hypothetical protein
MPLKISRAMTDLLLSFHQVMPGYLDFMSVFGSNLISAKCASAVSRCRAL